MWLALGRLSQNCEEARGSNGWRKGVLEEGWMIGMIIPIVGSVLEQRSSLEERILR